MPEKTIDIDSQETQEWLEALDSVMAQEGIERAHYLLEQLIAKARKSGAYLPYSANTAYLNTIPPSREERAPGDPGTGMAYSITDTLERAGYGREGQSFQRRTGWAHRQLRFIGNTVRRGFQSLFSRSNGTARG